MKSLNEIQLELNNMMPFLREKYSVTDMGIFGSFINNSQKKNSDVDILVTFKECPSLFKFIELQNLLSDKLHIKVDLVMKKALKENLKQYILDEVVTI